MSRKRKQSNDLGLRTVAELRRRCGVDDQWSIDTERGFRWWPDQQAQDVWSEPAFDDEGFVIWRIHVRTDLLRDLDVEPGLPDWVSETLIPGLGFSGVVREGPQGDRLRLAASAWVHEGNVEWVTDLLGWVMLVQAAEARAWPHHEDIDEGGRLWASEHPTSGARPTPDETLSVVAQLVWPAAELESPWVGPELAAAANLMNRPPCVLAQGDAGGLTAEYPFGENTSLLRVFPAFEHHLFRTGLRIELTIPDPMSDTAGALELNARELRHLVRAPFLGSWSPGEYGYVWRAFFPNALHQDGLLTNLVLGTAARARWVSESVYGDDWSESFERAQAKHAERLAAMLASLRRS